MRASTQMSSVEPDRQKVAKLFREYGPLVYRRALRLLNSEAEAEEALQDVFIRVLKAIHRFDDREQALNWLYRITTNHCLNALRGRKRRQMAMQAYRDAPRQETARIIDITTMRVLLSQADPRLAQAAIYVHLDGMSYSEAAPLLSVSKRTVGNLIARFNTWATKRMEES